MLMLDIGEMLLHSLAWLLLSRQCHSPSTSVSVKQVLRQGKDRKKSANVLI